MVFFIRQPLYHEQYFQPSNQQKHSYLQMLIKMPVWRACRYLSQTMASTSDNNTSNETQLRTHLQYNHFHLY